MFQYLINVIVQFNSLLNQSGLNLNVSYSSLALQLIVGIGIWAVVFYILKSVGIYLTCKNNNVKHGYLAFVPFVNYYLIGKLTGPVKFFSLKFKNMGILTGIFLFIMFGLNVANDYLIYFDEFYLLITHNVIPIEITHSNSLLVNLISALSDVSYFVTLIGVVWLNVGFIRKFLPKHYIWITLLLTFTFSELFFIIYNAILAIVILIMKKNKPFNIEEYIRKQQELQRMAYERAYGKDFNQPKKDNINDDPFEEFSQKHSEEGKPSMEQDVFSDFTPDKDFSKANENKENDNDNKND